MKNNTELADDFLMLEYEAHQNGNCNFCFFPESTARFRSMAQGLHDALRVLAEERHFSAEASREMMEILHAQEFRSGIPAGLPEAARVAHKTGEISTVAHDAGIVYLPDREPYVLVILTEWQPEVSGRHATIARISRAVYEHITDGEHDRR